MNNASQNTTAVFALVVALAVLTAFAFQGNRGLYETTEGRYAEAAREMVETGNYLVPTLDYQPHWTKPPLAYWGIAGGIIAFGQSEWGVRFYNAMAFFLTIMAVIALGSLLWDTTTALIAGLIYLSSPFPFFGSNVVSTDTLLTLWEVIAVLSYFKAYRAADSRKRSLWITVMWAVFGLAFMTKGPPGMLPLIPLIIWNYTRRNKASLFKAPGIPFFLVIGFTWFLVVIIKNPNLLHYYLKTEIVDRVSSAAVHNPEWYSPFTVYFPVLLGGQGAWLYFFSRGCWQFTRLGPRRNVAFFKSNEEILFLTLWIAIPLLIFSLSRSRLELYVLPLCAPLALMTARWISTHGGIPFRRIAFIAVLSVIVLTGLRLAVAYFPNRNNMKQVFQMTHDAGSRTSGYFVFEEDKLYGMQFYLQGTMQRVGLTGNEPWADASIDQLINDLKNEKVGTRYLILASRKRVPRLEAALANTSVDVEKIDSKYWVWFIISKKGLTNSNDGGAI